MNTHTLCIRCHVSVGVTTVGSGFQGTGFQGPAAWLLDLQLSANVTILVLH